jgi:hypothetical protein
MDALAHISPATKAKRAALNDAMRGLLDLRPRVTQLILDPGAIPKLRAAGLALRTLLHPALPGYRK